MSNAKVEDKQGATQPVTKGKMSNKTIILIIIGALLFLCCGCCAIFAIIPTPKTNNTDNTIKTEATKTVTATTQSVTATPTNTPTPTATPTPFPAEMKQTYIDNVNRYKTYADNGTANNAYFASNKDSVYNQFAKAKDLKSIYLSCGINKVAFDTNNYPEDMKKGFSDLKTLMSDYCLQQYGVMSKIVDLLNAQSNEDIYNASDNLSYFLGLSNEAKQKVYDKVTELTNLANSKK